MRVLVVEDEDSVRRSIVRMLEQGGFKVLGAISAEGTDVPAHPLTG